MGGEEGFGFLGGPGALWERQDGFGGGGGEVGVGNVLGEDGEPVTVFKVRCEGKPEFGSWSQEVTAADEADQLRVTLLELTPPIWRRLEVLGSITLASIWAAIGLGSLALQDRLDLPGMNVEGTHLPWTVTLASTFIVAWAASSLYREADQRFTQSETP